MLLLAGYLAQQYGLPPPKPKIVGIDLGTTFSSIGRSFPGFTYLFLFLLVSKKVYFQQLLLELNYFQAFITQLRVEQR